MAILSVWPPNSLLFLTLALQWESLEDVMITESVLQNASGDLDGAVRIPSVGH